LGTFWNPVRIKNMTHKQKKENKMKTKRSKTYDALLGIEKELYMIISSFEGESPKDSTQGRVYKLYDKVIAMKEKERKVI